MINKVFFRKPRLNERAAQCGFVTIEFVAGVALLLFPVALFVMTLPTWFERVDMAHEAAREAAREYVLSGSQANAQQAVVDIQNNYSLPNRDLTLSSLTGDPTQRGATITATVHTEIPALTIPIFDLNLPDISLNESHSEDVDLYRSEVDS